jgi:hypothetical protein
MQRWTFKTRHFRVELHTTREHGYQYDGDDENGETQAALDSGELVAFDSDVLVYLRGEDYPIGRDSLGGSVYAVDDIAEFWTAHRDPNPENRNTSAMKARNTCIGHYFPDMVRNAVKEAREALLERKAAIPYLRESA